MKSSPHIVWHEGKVTREDRGTLLRQRGVVLWFTGLSGSGKSTLAVELEKKLFDEGHLVYRLDGDNIRHGLNNDLGFEEKDRQENIRRVGEVAKLFSDAGLIVITSFISPYRRDRDVARNLFEKNDFFEIYISCPLEVCEARDPKGMYQKARAGKIQHFTGIHDPYEAPEYPDLILETQKNSISESLEKLFFFLRENKIL